MSLKLTAPDPNKDLMKFFGGVETFDFYGLTPKAIPVKVFEYEMEQRLKMLAVSEASEDFTGVVGELFDLDMDKFREVCKVNGLALVKLETKPGRDTHLVWLQWLLSNRGVDVTLDELKVRVDYGAVNEFVERLSPPKKAAAAGTVAS